MLLKIVVQNLFFTEMLVDIKEICFHYMLLFEVNQGRSVRRTLVITVMKIRVSKTGKFLNLLIDSHLKEDYALCRKVR
jgi:hypothetical protein